MDQWLGQHESDLVTQWGLPDKETTYGYRKVYIYAKPIYAGQNGTQYRYSTFFIDHKGIIQEWNVRDLTVPVEQINIRLLTK
jgi:hypothetical protein